MLPHVLAHEQPGDAFKTSFRSQPGNFEGYDYNNGRALFVMHIPASLPRSKQKQHTEEAMSDPNRRKRILKFFN